jgi:hypothetical protein
MAGLEEETTGLAIEQKGGGASESVTSTHQDKRWGKHLSYFSLTCDGGVDGLRLGRSVGEGLGACMWYMYVGM